MPTFTILSETVSNRQAGRASSDNDIVVLVLDLLATDNLRKVRTGRSRRGDGQGRAQHQQANTLEGIHLTLAQEKTGLRGSGWKQNRMSLTSGPQLNYIALRNGLETCIRASVTTPNTRLATTSLQAWFDEMMI